MKTTGEMRLVLALAALILIPLATLAQAGGNPVSGLQLALSPDNTEAVQIKVPKFRLDFRNVGENDLILNVGIMLANGKKQYPRAVALILTDAQGKSRLFDLREPSFIAGRVDPFVVPVPAGSTFSIRVDLDKYWAAPSKEFGYTLTPGTYSIEAQFIGMRVTQASLDMKGIALMPYWEGTVTSNQLRFEVPKR